MESALLKQNPHWESAYTDLHQRDIFESVIAKLHLKQMQVIKGIRRSGKTTLFKLIINRLLESTDGRSILYVNLDDPYFTELYSDSKHLHRLLELSEKITETKVDYLFLDEIQNVSNWEKFVKSLYDSGAVKKIFITGSNASLLDGEYATLLSGRYIEERVTAPSFSEILKMKNIDSRLELLQRKSEVLRIIDEMMTYGSFFEVLAEPVYKREIILSYYETIILKDCIANNNLRDAKTFKEITHFIVSNSTNLYSYNSIAKATGVNDNSIKEYIRILEDAYLCGEIKHYSYSLKEQMRHKKKIYINDNGFLTQTAFRFSKNFGSTFENLVYTEFVKRGYEIYFYHKDFECDFVCKKDNEVLAVQVCYELTAHNRERELNGLKKLQINPSRKLLLTHNQNEQTSEDVEILAFWDYFFSR